MAIEQLELETGLNKVDFAIKLLREHEPEEGYYLAFSGGKDSVVIYDLAVKAGVKFDAHYCVSPIDPPQIWKFIKEYYPDVQWDYHARGFWKMVAKKGLPRRNARWCCEFIKEAGGIGRTLIVGSRSSESVNRKIYAFLREYKRNKKKYLSPILNFTDYDVWQYIRGNDLPYCELYDKGFKRIGCILCPFERNIQRSLDNFPKIVNLWKLACNRIVKRYKEQGYLTLKGKPVKRQFETGEELFNWWIKRK